MNRLNTMTTQELVERFAAIALEQDKALRAFDSAKFNRLYVQMEAINAELKQRDGDQRSALLPLLDDANGQVRLKAAIATLALAPKAARQVLNAIADGKYSRQTPYARDMIEGLDDGDYKPS
jgi:2-oxo-4-hydroxy-4-carboxy--5-ureidoimidazoline (OHCU) decarboxylase